MTIFVSRLESSRKMNTFPFLNITTYPQSSSIDIERKLFSSPGSNKTSLASNVPPISS